MPAFACDKEAPCCGCCGCCCVEVAPKRDGCPRPLVCCGAFMPDCCAVAGVLLNKLVKPPVCAGGCDVDAPPSEGKADDDAGFGVPREPPNRPPPSPPVLAGCDVPDAAPVAPPPRPPNKLDPVPDVDVFNGAPNSGFAEDAPVEAGCDEPPRLPKSDDMLVGLMCWFRAPVDCAGNNRVHETMEQELGR